MAVNINSTDKASPAEIAGLVKGDKLLTINGNEINDMLDYQFYSTGQKLELEVMKSGELSYLKIEKEEYSPLGCVFERYLIDEKHSCKNKCIFCFIDQMPPGLRETLYFKDDDERLSFLFGNYVTLTNLTPREANRIVQMHISPINISVHTVNPDLRVKMMTNKHAGEALKYIDMFAAGGITMNCQLVLCRGINDGQYLRESLEKLGSLYPEVNSIAAVPSGLTKFREGLFPLQPYDEATACEVLDIMEEYGEKYKQKYGVRVVYPADEWYLLAKREMPSSDFYDEFSQLENGVGMWRTFHDEFMAEVSVPRRLIMPRSVDVVTGELAYPLISMLCKEAQSRISHVKIKVHKIKNDFFGGNVSVAGLVTGTDIIKQVSGKMQSKTLCIPETMLREEKDKFLDDITLTQLSEKLNCKLRILPQNGADALKKML